MGTPWRWAVLILLAGLVAGCAARGSAPAPSGPPASPAQGASRPAAAGFTLTSSAFADGQAIPTRYTADGASVSPPLTWTPPPAGTKELVLVVSDPDAPGGTYYHWTLYGLAPSVTSLPENVTPSREGKQGRNSAGTVGYTPPSPPPGKVHHYEFRLYALDHASNLPAGASLEEVTRAVEKGVLAQAELVGTYRR